MIQLKKFNKKEKDQVASFFSKIEIKLKLKKTRRPT